MSTFQAQHAIQQWFLNCGTRANGRRRRPSSSGSELGGSRGATAPQNFAWPSKWSPQNFSDLFLKVLHRPLTAPLVAKLAPPVPPPYENVWLRPCSSLYVNRPIFWFFPKKYFHSKVFAYWVLLINSGIAVYFLCWFLQIAIIISHSHFVYVAFVAILVFHMLIELYWEDWVFLEQGGSWWQYRTHKSYKIRKRLGTMHCNRECCSLVTKLSRLDYAQDLHIIRWWR